MIKNRTAFRKQRFILVLLFGLLSVSCIPIVKEIPAFPVDAAFLQGLYTDQGEPILVLPVWRNYPAFVSEHSIRESSTLAFGDPLYLQVADLDKVHKQVPGRTIAGIMVLPPLAAVGRGVDFYGFIILGESGRITWNAPGYPKSRVLYSVFISQDEKNELLRTFRGASEADASPLWRFTGKLKLTIDYSTDQRDDLAGFLQGVDDEISGRGVFLYMSGDRFEGEYLDGRPHGQGVIEGPQGHRYEGAWSAGAIQGRGIYQWPDGMRYDGELVKGKPEGRGKMVNADSNWYDGEWHDGYAEGEGRSMIEGRIYEGAWVRGCLRGGDQAISWGLPPGQCR